MPDIDDLQPENVADTPGTFMPPQPNPQMQGGAPQMPPDQQPQVTQAPGTNGSGVDPELAAAAVHHSRLADILNHVGSILGGNTTLRMTKNADGSVSVAPDASTAGEKWGRVAAAALSGAAKGFQVGQGPGGAQRAAAAGIQSGMAMPQAQRDQTLATAEQANNQNRQEQLFKANMALLNQKVVAGAFDMKQKELTASNGEEDRAENIQQHMTEMNAKKFHVSDMEDTANAYNSNSELQQAHHDGRTVFFKTYDGQGKVNGGDIYVVPEDKMNALNEKPFTRQRLEWNGDPNKPPTMSSFPIDARAMKVKDQMTTWQSDEDHNTQVTTNYNKAKGDLEQAQVARTQAQATLAEAKATGAAAGAASAGTWHEAIINNQHGMQNDKTLEFRPMGVQTPGERNANDRADATTRQYVDKNYVSKARDVEASYSGFEDAYQEHLQNPKTGAAGMYALSQHLGTTFGTVKGARVTKAMIEEHLGARGVSDQMQALIQKATNGDPLTANQWNDFRTLIHNSRTEAWRKAADGARGNEVDPNNFLPSDLRNTPVAQGYNRTPAGTAPPPGPGGPAPAAGGFNWGQHPVVTP
jgi:hypothetical protein